jgi:MFS family permease
MSFGPALGGVVAKEFGFLRVFLISGTLIFLVFWMVLFLLPRVRLVLDSRPTNKQGAAVARRLLQNRPLLGCWLVTLGGCFGLGMFVTYIPLHAQNQGLHVGQIGLVFALQGLCNAVSRIPFGQLSDRVSKRGNLVVIGLVGFVASMLGFAVSGSLVDFMLFAAALGISMGLAFTSIGALIAEVVPQESRGLAMGGYNTCIYFGMMLSSALMGPVIQVIGFESAFVITAGVNFVFIGFFHLFIRGFASF